MKLYPFSIIKQGKEFYSAMVRLSLGLFLSLYIWLGTVRGEFDISHTAFVNFAAFYFSVTILLTLDLFRNPESHFRRYLTLFFDVSCTSYAAFLTGGAGSEFILIYIWLYIAYGARYGLSYLLTAVIFVMLEYNVVLYLDNDWVENRLSSSAYIFVLVLMPLYLYSMIKQLHKAKRAAEQATRAKSSFLATMSHEIRTPMSGIIGTAHLLQNTQQSKEQQEYIRALLDASKSLHALIDDILDFSKIEANKLELTRSSFDLHQTINEVLAVLSPNAEYHNLDFIVYIDPELPVYIIGDSQRIRQILFNLVGNAIKFTDQGEVSLNITRIADQFSDQQVSLRFDIIDTGIGISKELQQKIFDSFTQADSTSPHRFGGTGLGTTISKQLVEFMGGEIGLSSEPGKGSHFWFTLTLPVKEAGNIQERYRQRLKDKNTDVLVVNDSNYEVIQRYCNYFGLNITRYHSDQELLNGMEHSRAQYRNCDLVILSDDTNHKLPIKLASQISRIECVSGARAKKVFLGYLGQHARAQELGNDYFDAYVTKPINFERLGDTLIELLSPETSSISKDKLNKPMETALKILIAEDEDINAMVLSSFLQDAGNEVIRVKDGAQAVDALNENAFDLVFMDMRMPEMNGLEATLLWRQQEPEGQHIPIIALTANATVDDRKACMEIGMDDFVTKPISPEQLLNIIRKYYQP